jgi:hypothetical protein
VRLFCFILIGLIHVNTGNVFGGEDENTAPKTPDHRPLPAPVTSPFSSELSPIGERSPLSSRTMNIFGSPLTAGACASAGTGGGIFCPFTPGTIGTLSNTTSPERAGLNDTWMAITGPCDRSRIEAFQLSDYIEECSHGDGLCSAASHEPSPTGPTDIGKPLFSSAFLTTKEVELEWLNSDGSRETDSMTVSTTIFDRKQFDEVDPIIEGEDSFLEIDASFDDESKTVHSLPTKPLVGSSVHIKLSEASMLENMQTNYPIEHLPIIGKYCARIQNRLIHEARFISQTMCGGVKRSIMNVGTFDVSVIDNSGRISPLLESGWPNAGFLSPRKPSIKARTTGSTVFPVGSPTSTIPTKKENVLGKGIDIIQYKGLCFGAKERHNPVFFSDSDILEEGTKPIRNNVFKALTKIWENFPETTIALLANQIKSTLTPKTSQKLSVRAKSKMKKEISKLVRKTRRLKSIAPLFSMLSETDISKIHGHSEQFMARFFENHIMPQINRHHSFMKEGDSDQSLREVIFHMASLQDCCCWCSRLVSSLSGPRTLSDGTKINVKIIMTTGKEFNTLKVSEKGIKSICFRANLYTPSIVPDLSACPSTMFHYA